MHHQKLKTLFVERPLLNSSEIRAWAKSQGFESTLPDGDMHVTIAFSKQPIDWGHVEPINRKLTNRGGKRSIEQFGEAVVICFPSKLLHQRWKEFQDIGASWDFPDYRSHVTVTYEAMPEGVEPYQGDLVFGEESFSEVNENWAAEIEEERV